MGRKKQQAKKKSRAKGKKSTKSNKSTKSSKSSKSSKSLKNERHRKEIIVEKSDSEEPKGSNLTLLRPQVNKTQLSIGSKSKKAAKVRKGAAQNLIGDIFLVDHRLGGGNFGQIFKGTNLVNESIVVVKLENVYSRKLYLPLEFKMYQMIGLKEGIPKVYYFGKTSDGRRHGIVMEMLGPSLEKLFEAMGGRFSVKTVIQIAIQVMDRLEIIHDSRVIFRDIKPENFLIGRPGTLDENLIYMVDFGLAKEYVSTSGEHVPFTDGKMLTGTARYMSVNTHEGKEQSRRDDLEATAYMLIFFARGALPWQGMYGKDAMEKFRNIGHKKKYTTTQELCESLPLQFARYVDYVKRLKFDERPNYDYIRDIFRSAFRDAKYNDDGQFDWTHIVENYADKLFEKVDDLGG